MDCIERKSGDDRSARLGPLRTSHMVSDPKQMAGWIHKRIRTADEFTRLIQSEEFAFVGFDTEGSRDAMDKQNKPVEVFLKRKRQHIVVLGPTDLNEVGFAFCPSLLKEARPLEEVRDDIAYERLATCNEELRQREADGEPWMPGRGPRRLRCFGRQFGVQIANTLVMDHLMDLRPRPSSCAQALLFRSMEMLIEPQSRQLFVPLSDIDNAQDSMVSGFAEEATRLGKKLLLVCFNGWPDIRRMYTLFPTAARHFSAWVDMGSILVSPEASSVFPCSVSLCLGHFGYFGGDQLSSKKHRAGNDALRHLALAEALSKPLSDGLRESLGLLPNSMGRKYPPVSAKPSQSLDEWSGSTSPFRVIIKTGGPSSPPSSGAEGCTTLLPRKIGSPLKLSSLIYKLGLKVNLIAYPFDESARGISRPCPGTSTETRAAQANLPSNSGAGPAPQRLTGRALASRHLGLPYAILHAGTEDDLHECLKSLDGLVVDGVRLAVERCSNDYYQAFRVKIAAAKAQGREKTAGAQGIQKLDSCS